MYTIPVLVFYATGNLAARGLSGRIDCVNAAVVYRKLHKDWTVMAQQLPVGKIHPGASLTKTPLQVPDYHTRVLCLE
ncbi:MAG: hypothetical protein ABIS36_19735 [Chryseolinea sp.]